jgi:hypothetical protein
VNGEDQNWNPEEMNIIMRNSRAGKMIITRIMNRDEENYHDEEKS